MELLLVLWWWWGMLLMLDPLVEGGREVVKEKSGTE
jgi:hypothetical protein